jgi:cell shape-determining protein MreC
MKRPWLNQRRALAITAALLLVSSMLPARWANWLSHRPRALVHAVVVPITDPLHKLSTTVRSDPQIRLELGDQAQLEANYQSLLQYARQLEGELADAREQIAQLSQIRQHLGLGRTGSVPASVTGWPSATHSLILNRGRRHDLTEGLVVAEGFNLVGRLSHVSAVNATVRLVTAPGTHMLVRILPAEPGPAQRELRVQLQVEADGRSFFARTDVDAPVRAGDLAHLADPENWPAEAQGLVVGRVESVDPDPRDPLLRRKVVVRPLRTMTNLTRVVVIVPRE